MTQTTSRKGVDLIKEFESLRLVTYLCSAGVLTIGYGHTGLDVLPGLRISEARANELLVADLRRFEKGVSEAVKVPLSQTQFDALIAFAFNVGLGNFRSSTLLRKLNARDYAGAALEFPRWNKAKGVILNGLIRRRAAEQALFRA